ncbi:hypothetical protein Smp_197010 [Schistosoma mansoni]|uniref:Transcriptional regulator n=1 Tax=Schistosoma mansoni TaxID=6183 RepID=G4VAD7_SCHMA|nr:hypothetical protein Smp_197010 [Schistosoma mansoni]|eukprot:XP_018649309.1 hypothetical protein Smp_197010 [Schistosoma mansoni]
MNSGGSGEETKKMEGVIDGAIESADLKRLLIIS